MDSLKRRVLAYDRERNTPRQMEVTSRAVELKRICFDCRQSPDERRYREDWLAAHPMPENICPKQCGARNSFNSADNHKRWHVDLYVSASMPAFAALLLTGRCMFCGGHLVEITI